MLITIAIIRVIIRIIVVIVRVLRIRIIVIAIIVINIIVFITVIIDNTFIMLCTAKPSSSWSTSFIPTPFQSQQAAMVVAANGDVVPRSLCNGSGQRVEWHLGLPNTTM